MVHYANLMSALGGAMPVCMIWILAGTEDNYFNARDIYAFALSEGGDDEELEEEQFYVVSAEGAIGLAVKYEYLTRWIFIPVDDEEVRERELARLREELQYDIDHENDEPEESLPDEKPDVTAGIEDAGGAAGADEAAGPAFVTADNVQKPEDRVVEQEAYAAKTEDYADRSEPDYHTDSEAKPEPEYHNEPARSMEERNIYQERPVMQQSVYGERSVPPQGAYQERSMPPQGMYQERPIPPQGVYQERPVPPQGVYQERPVQPQQGGMAPERKRFCIQCGNQLAANSKFCPKCGTKAIM